MFINRTHGQQHQLHISSSVDSTVAWKMEDHTEPLEESLRLLMDKLMEIENGENENPVNLTLGDALKSSNVKFICTEKKDLERSVFVDTGLVTGREVVTKILKTPCVALAGKFFEIAENMYLTSNFSFLLQ